MRINVVGTSGCGKSTVGKRLAERLSVPYIQLDELYWKSNWGESTDEELFPKLEKALSPDEWVLDGNYNRTTSIKWKRVQMVVYLDLPFHIVLYRIIRRSLLRGIRNEELWHGNKETLWKHLFTTDSMILWTIKRFSMNRKRYTELFEVFVKHSDKVARVSTWGTVDSESWKNGWPVKGRTNYPLLFDRNYSPKEAYHSIMNLAS